MPEMVQTLKLAAKDSEAAISYVQIHKRKCHNKCIDEKSQQKMRNCKNQKKTLEL